MPTSRRAGNRSGLGDRLGPFAGKSPCSVYGPGTRVAVTAVTDLELAVCWSPGGGGYPVRLIPPVPVTTTRLGRGDEILGDVGLARGRVGAVLARR